MTVREREACRELESRPIGVMLRQHLASMMLGITQPLVLVADDEPMVREVLGRYLKQDGFRVRGRRGRAYRRRGASRGRARPGPPGLDAAAPRRVRGVPPEDSSTLVIMLTARGHETDRGLELGADDYIAKPFLATRGRRTCPGGPAARNPAPDPTAVRRFGALEIDPGRPRRSPRPPAQICPPTPSTIRLASASPSPAPSLRWVTSLIMPIA
jgi:CheY-like chemotaxis protein